MVRSALRYIGILSFVALGLAVISHTDGPRAAVGLANELLDRHAPIFEAD